MFNDNFLQAFASPIFIRQFTDQQKLNDTLANTIRDLANSESSDDAQRSHEGGYYSDGKLFDTDLPGIQAVKAMMLDGIEEYAKQIMHSGQGRRQLLKKTMFDIHGWCALTKANNYQPPHCHAGANISGIYYIEVPDKPEPQGQIDLMNPLELQEMTFLPGAATTHCRVKPLPGLLLMFPAYLRHTVHPFFGDGERLIVVFNATLGGKRSYGH